MLKNASVLNVCTFFLVLPWFSKQSNSLHGIFCPALGRKKCNEEQGAIGSCDSSKSPDPPYMALDLRWLLECPRDSKKERRPEQWLLPCLLGSPDRWWCSPQPQLCLSNLIGVGVGAVVGTQHSPHQLLCFYHACQPFLLPIRPFPYISLSFYFVFWHTGFSQNCLCYHKFHYSLEFARLSVGHTWGQWPHCPKNPPVANNSAERERQILFHNPPPPGSMICYWQTQSYAGTKSCYEILSVLDVIMTMVVFCFKDRTSQSFPLSFSPEFLFDPFAIKFPESKHDINVLLWLFLFSLFP